MKELQELRLEEVSGGDRVTAFCNGFAAAAGVYSLGAVANLWNPMGWGGTIAISAVALACVAY
ncbi:hypothetical protein [Nitritalea halalkaliphila]|uniref:hypothetical protein n=1 Tax=Nitritalea halalkaliphila TaxID=590849 RepID=UPI0012E9F1F4|nr:hypothetical protein [Nitritalea halalkaliphila]